MAKSTRREKVNPMPDKDVEQISFRVDRTLADSVRRKLLDHKIATRERITITDICTKALRDYIANPDKN